MRKDPCTAIFFDGIHATVGQLIGRDFFGQGDRGIAL